MVAAHRRCGRVAAIQENRSHADAERAFDVLTHAVAPGHVSLMRALEAMTSAPARILGAEGHGGPIEAGRPANLVVFDPNEEWLVQAPFASKARNCAFLGKRLTGRVRYTMLRGDLTVLDGKATR